MKVEFMIRISCLLFLVLVANLSSSLAAPRSSGKFIVYVGTYSGPKSKGIYAFRFDASTGRLTPLGLVAETPEPSFLAIHPNSRFLYAVNEVDEFAGKKNNGGVSAFAIDARTGKLRLLNQQSTGGGSPCHVIVDAKGRNVLVANYGGGSVAVLPIQPDGSLREPAAFIQHSGASVNKERQQGPHAHGIYLDAANRFAAVADLGLDKLMIYRFDPAAGSLAANDPPSQSVKPGSGPRHFAFHPNGRFAYVDNEMASTVTAFAWDGKKGRLRELQSLGTLPEGFAGDNSTAELELHRTGRFLYVSNRGDNTIAVFAVERDGKLRVVEHRGTQGKTPRSFGIDPTGRFLLAANQAGDSIVVFRIDQETGRLTPTGHNVEVGKPVCIKFVSSPSSVVRSPSGRQKTNSEGPKNHY
jgi:6-phosphogluconolactonase